MPEPGFLRVGVPLKASLGESELSRTALSTGFEIPQVRRLTHAYVGGETWLDEVEHFEDADASFGDWRSKYFTWTQLGYWCSEQCLADLHMQFQRRGYAEREQQLRRLEHLRDAAALATARSAFLAMLSRLWEALGERAPEFLDGTGAIDRSRYSQLFDKRVQRDLELIEDEEFQSRYVTGFEIIQVPRFRTDLRGWREFLDSMARQLSLDNAKPRPRSKLLQAVRKAFVQAGCDPDALNEPVELLDELRRTWGDAPTGTGKVPKPVKLISTYHRE